MPLFFGNKPRLRPSILTAFIVLTVPVFVTIITVTYFSNDRIARQSAAHLIERFRADAIENIEDDINPIKSMVRAAAALGTPGKNASPATNSNSGRSGQGWPLAQEAGDAFCLLTGVTPPSIVCGFDARDRVANTPMSQSVRVPLPIVRRGGLDGRQPASTLNSRGRP